MQHFIRVPTVCKSKKDLQTIEYNIIWKIITITGHPLDVYKGLSQICCIKPEARPPIYLLHSIKSILCYEEKGPVSYEREGLKFQQNSYFF